MITFSIALIVLVLGYFIYGAFVNRIFGPDDRKTPALTMNDGVDYMPLPTWKIFRMHTKRIWKRTVPFPEPYATMICCRSMCWQTNKEP